MIPIRQQIEIEPAGSRIDKWFSTFVMNKPPGGKYGMQKSYSTNIAHAMEVVEKIKGRANFHLFFDDEWTCILAIKYSKTASGIADYYGIAETAPLAITRALLLWAVEKGK